MVQGVHWTSILGIERVGSLGYTWAHPMIYIVLECVNTKSFLSFYCFNAIPFGTEVHVGSHVDNENKYAGTRGG